jgi:hypothetical protein
MAKSALPLLALGAGALLLMSKKKTTAKPTDKQPDRQPKDKAAQVPADQVEPGEIMVSGSTMTDQHGAIEWRVRRYAGGSQFYVEVYDPDDREFEVVPVGHMENDPVRLFDAVDSAAEWTIAFIKSIDRGEPVPEPEPEPEPQPEPPPGPEPDREEALGMQPGVWPNVHVNARYGLVSPYRTPETTVSIRRKSGMVHYPAKPHEAKFVGWNPKNPEEALIDVDAKGEYSIMTHDGGPKGVFIAEWVLKVTEG